MQVPSRAELRRFFGEERASQVRFLEAVTSWPSLRILEYLYDNEPVTTGELARGINMDMREVRDRLETLEQSGVLDADGDEWVAGADEVRITIRNDDGLEIRYATEPAGSTAPADDPPRGLVARARRLVGSLVPGSGD